MQGEMLDIQLNIDRSPMNISFGIDRSPMDISFEIERGGGGYTPGVPPGGNTGDLLAKRTDSDFDVEWITPANDVEQDNTRPITAAAVYTTVGNINALLATI